MNWSELNEHQLNVYSAPWCPDCRRLKGILNDNSIDYTEIDIDQNPEAADRLVEKTGHRAIPYVEIDGAQCVRGWHKDSPGRWDEATFFAEFAGSLNS